MSGSGSAHSKHERRLRSTGTEDAPLGRGVVHLAALILAVPCSIGLVVHAGPGGGVWLYAIGLVGLFAVSATYHRFNWSQGARRRWRQLDYATIYFFIAASMTPYCLLGVPGALSTAVLALGWTAATAAILTVIISFDRARKVLSSGYLGLGWLVVVTFPLAFSRLSVVELLLLGATGALYTLGAIVLATRWPDPRPETFGYHEVWHSFVVAATICYFLMVWEISAPRG